MNIKVLPLGNIQANCYLISTHNAAVVIDPGFDSRIVTDFLNENCHKERIIILTHAHFDHVSGAYKLREETGTKIAVGAFDNPALSDPCYNLSTMFGAELIPFSADILLKDNELLNIGDLSFKVIHTPGHTVGSICLLINNILFSGDTLFAESVGRTDFPGGDFSTLKASIKKLYTLDEDTTILSGHGAQTTIIHEKQNNPYVRG